MKLSVENNYSAYQSKNLNKKQVITQYVQQSYGDTVTFKAAVNRQSLMQRLASVIFAGGGLAAIANFMKSLSNEEQEVVYDALNEQFADVEQSSTEEKTSMFGGNRAAEDFKTMKLREWVNKYKENPKNFEKLLLEEDTHENETGKRLYFVKQFDVLRTFYKNPDAIKRLYTRENVLNIERKMDGYNSAIEELSKDNTDILDGLMLETDSDGRTLLHILANEYQLTDMYHSTGFANINKAYSKRLNELFKIYLTQDANGKYPLEYIKDKSEEEQKKALNIVKRTFEDEPELLIKILETIDAKDEIAKVQKFQDIVKNGYEHFDEDGNRIVEQNLKSYEIEKILNGEERIGLSTNYKKYNPQGLLIERGEGDWRSSWNNYYSYDEKGRLIEKKLKAAYGETVTRYEYDEDGNQRIVDDGSNKGWSQW